MTKRIMRKLVISEISACDRPAQEYARAVIMKRDTNPDATVVPRQKEQKMDYSKTDRGALAMLALEGLAKALREGEPHLSPEQAFSRVLPILRTALPQKRSASRAEPASSQARRLLARRLRF
jgi:hypothetical protein